MTRKKPGSTPPSGELRIRNSAADLLIFTRQAGAESINVRLEDGSIWLTQKLIAELFEVTVPTINEHLKNIFAGGELDEPVVVRNFRITAADGKGYQTRHLPASAEDVRGLEQIGRELEGKGRGKDK